MYAQDPASHDCLDSLLPDSGCMLNTLDHRRLNVFALDDDDLISRLRRQIEHSLQWGANYGINHLSAFSLTRRPEYQEALELKLTHHLRMLNRFCSEYGFPMHIENTYHDIDLYERVMLRIAREALDQLHFCFDVGHAKVWSLRPLKAWFDFLADLERSGIRLHFHLHTDRGLSDEHLSFLDAEWIGLCELHEYTAPWNSFEALSMLEQRFPQARKVMEVQPSEARENPQRVLEEIDRIGRRHAQVSA